MKVYLRIQWLSFNGMSENLRLELQCRNSSEDHALNHAVSIGSLVQSLFLFTVASTQNSTSCLPGLENTKGSNWGVTTKGISVIGDDIR